MAQMLPQTLSEEEEKNYFQDVPSLIRCPLKTRKISAAMSLRVKKANMKTFQLALTVVLLGLQGSKAGKVASCLTCAGPNDSDCAKGTGKGN